MFKAAETALGDPNIGLKVGYQFRVSKFGDTGRIFTQCENIRDVSQHNARYQPLAIDMAKIWFSDEIDPDSGEILYSHNYALKDHPSIIDPDQYKHLIDLVFGAYGTAFRWLSWASAKELKSAWFQYSEPADIDIYKTVFNCPLRFGQNYNALQLHKDAALSTISTFDPVKRAQLVSRLDGLMNASVSAESFIAALSSTIRQKISQGRLNREDVVKAMGLSKSQFDGSLIKAGISYKDVVSRVRKNMIEELFNTEKSLTEIAQILGYNDQAAFNKAFRRLYDMSPSQFRKDR